MEGNVSVQGVNRELIASQGIVKDGINGLKKRNKSNKQMKKVPKQQPKPKTQAKVQASDNTRVKKPSVMVSKYTDSLKKDMNKSYGAAEKFMAKNSGNIMTDASDRYNNDAANEMYNRGKKTEGLYKASLTKLPSRVINKTTKKN